MKTRLPSGIGIPFYPMRPTPGLRAADDVLAHDLANGWIAQGKLDGDRVMLGVSETGLIWANRHLALYSFNIKNAAKFARLPVGTCLDGECWKGNFYPFEALAIGTRSLLRTPVEDRIAAAKQVCLNLGVDWLFEPISEGWVGKNRGVPQLEGYVKKRRGSFYEILGVQRESEFCTKCKWR
jgi:hypothetical protein